MIEAWGEICLSDGSLAAKSKGGLSQSAPRDGGSVEGGGERLAGRAIIVSSSMRLNSTHAVTKWSARLLCNTVVSGHSGDVVAHIEVRD